jgi:two-component system, LytTR family, sensor kinase
VPTDNHDGASGPLPVTSGAIPVTNGARVAARERPRHHVRVKLIRIFLLVAVFFALQNVLVHVSRAAPIDWQWDVMHEFVYWLIWAAFAPAILGAARRWPVSREGGWRTALPHLGVMALVAPLQISTTYLTHWTILRAAGVLPASQAGAWLVARGPGVVWGTFTGFIYYWVIAAVYWAVEYQRLYREGRLQAARLEASLGAARLDALRAQLQPHFLFNTLNAISVLTVDDPPRAKQMLLRLSDLLRRAIGEGEGHEVPLAAELALLEAYLGIQRARFGDRLRVQLAIEPEVRDALVPTLLLQPLVENAIRHGLEDGASGGAIAVTARRQHETLTITVQDDGRGLPPAAGGREARDGVGLANTRERLLRLYGDRQRLELRAPAGGGGGVAVEVSLPFHTEPIA